MSVLALASTAELEDCWKRLGQTPPYTILRGPELGLVMVRARAGGTGVRFNLGEMTVTRCTVQLGGGRLGHAWVGGRNPRHAELAAALDATLQAQEPGSGLEESLIGPLERAQAARRADAAARAATSRVEFFTMVRGED